MAAVTVVIATRNRAPELVGTLGRLVAACPDHPVIVVDNGSTDGTARRVRARYPAVTVVALPANFGAAARTVGARLATTPLVAFADDDSWWEPGALDAAAELFAGDARLALAAGAVVVEPAAVPDPLNAVLAAGPLDEWRRPDPRGRRGVTGFMACAAVVRRPAFLAAGGFEPRFVVGGEEGLVALDLAAAGWKLVFAPEAVAHHLPSPSRDAARRRRRTVTNDLLTGVLRLPAAATAARAATALRDGQGWRTAAVWQGLTGVAAGTAWALPRRRVVPSGVLAAWRAPPAASRASR